MIAVDRDGERVVLSTDPGETIRKIVTLHADGTSRMVARLGVVEDGVPLFVELTVDDLDVLGAIDLAAREVSRAVTVEGRQPAYHRAQLDRLRRDWPVLRAGLHKLVAVTR